MIPSSLQAFVHGQCLSNFGIFFAFQAPKHITNQVAFLRCGMYGGPNGGTPEGDIWHGQYVGDDVVSGETYDANDPQVRARICGLDQHQVRYTCDGETATEPTPVTGRRNPRTYAVSG